MFERAVGDEIEWHVEPDGTLACGPRSVSTPGSGAARLRAYRRAVARLRNPTAVRLPSAGMRDLWAIDQSVLASIAEQIEDQGKNFADTDVIAELLGPEAEGMDRSLRRLCEADLIRAKPMLGGNWVISGVTERGLREVGAWPSREQYAKQLIAALEDVAENDPDPVQRSKAHKVLSTISEFGYKTFIDFSASLLAKVASGG